MIERAVVADLGGFADHHTHAVVDEDAASDGSPGMDLDSRQPATPVRQPAAQPSRPIGPQRVRHRSVPNERVQARVAGHDLPGRARCRVALEYDRDVFAYAGKHAAIVTFPTESLKYSNGSRPGSF